VADKVVIRKSHSGGFVATRLNVLVKAHEIVDDSMLGKSIIYGDLTGDYAISGGITCASTADPELLKGLLVRAGFEVIGIIDQDNVLREI
jgi:hypothetical protein